MDLGFTIVKTSTDSKHTTLSLDSEHQVVSGTFGKEVAYDS